MLEKMLKFEPNEFRFLIVLAEEWERLADYKKAILYYNKLISLGYDTLTYKAKVAKLKSLIK
jgi:cytochrome c-type biogenesis protein CcmH/NrfG